MGAGRAGGGERAHTHAHKVMWREEGGCASIEINRRSRSSLPLPTSFVMEESVNETSQEDQSSQESVPTPPRGKVSSKLSDVASDFSRNSSNLFCPHFDRRDGT